MSIIDHGAWQPYTPDVHPEMAPGGAVFAKRDSDGIDWYDYVHPGTNFAADTVKFMARMRPGVGYIVGPAVYDATMLFPANHIVGEIDDYSGSDPQADYSGKLYDPADGSFSDPPPPEMPAAQSDPKILKALDAILARLEQLERKHHAP